MNILKRTYVCHQHLNPKTEYSQDPEVFLMPPLDAMPFLKVTNTFTSLTIH